MKKKGGPINILINRKLFRDKPILKDIGVFSLPRLKNNNGFEEILYASNIS